MEYLTINVSQYDLQICLQIKVVVVWSNVRYILI